MRFIRIQLVILVMGLYFACSYETVQNTEIRSISAGQLKTDLENKREVILLDVRTEAEFNGPLGRLNGALLIPLQELEKRIQELDPYKDKPIVVYCRSGNRSRTATKFLQENGFEVYNLEGGMLDWNRLQKPSN